MSFILEYIDDHLFIDGVFGTVVQKGYFYCNHPNCPYSLRVTLQRVDGKRRVVAVESVVCSIHYHENDGKSKSQARKEIVRDLLLIKKDEKSPEAEAAKARHEHWHQDAIRSSDDFKKELKHKEMLRTYIESHLGSSGKQIRDACGSHLDPHGICNMKRRMRGTATNLRDLLRNGGHHLLGHDGNDIIVF